VRLRKIRSRVRALTPAFRVVAEKTGKYGTDLYRNGVPRDFSGHFLNSARYNPSTNRNANAKPADTRGFTMAENNTTNAAAIDIPASI
jgi:hypothetical protein